MLWGDLSLWRWAKPPPWNVQFSCNQDGWRMRRFAFWTFSMKLDVAPWMGSWVFQPHRAVMMGSWHGDWGWKRFDGWGPEFLQFLEDHFEPRIYLQGGTLFSMSAWNIMRIHFDEMFFFSWCLFWWNKKCIGIRVFYPFFLGMIVFAANGLGGSATSQLACLVARSPSSKWYCSSWSTSMNRMYDHWWVCWIILSACEARLFVISNCLLERVWCTLSPMAHFPLCQRMNLERQHHYQMTYYDTSES